jgi:hypothetical protein
MPKPVIMSLWACDLCQVQVAIQGQPRRQRHATCLTWMRFVRLVCPR